MTAGLVRLAAGARLMLDGAEWAVEECLPQSGRVVLRGAGGQRRPVTIRRWSTILVSARSRPRLAQLAGNWCWRT